MTTKKESTNQRDLTFSHWVRFNLPDSDTGYCVSDIDFYIYDWKAKNHMLLELKQHGGRMATCQRIMYRDLAKWIGKGADKDGWTFYGWHQIVFSATGFDDGACFVNNKRTTEQDLIELLSFNCEPPKRIEPLDFAELATYIHSHSLELTTDSVGWTVATTEVPYEVSQSIDLYQEQLQFVTIA